MLTLRPTKMLAKQLGISVPATPPAVPSRVADWCMHGFLLGSDPWLIFCNTASLYSVCASAKGVMDGESLARRAGGMINQVLEKNGLKLQAEKFAAELADFQWAPIPGRSVLGSINELICLAEPFFDDPDLLPEALSRRLGETPMSALGMNNPNHVFGTLPGG